MPWEYEALLQESKRGLFILLYNVLIQGYSNCRVIKSVFIHAVCVIIAITVKNQNHTKRAEINTLTQHDQLHNYVRFTDSLRYAK